ncbi:protein-associating with the carboxyl-terminal domain of ezrin-like [Dysidea avara]|uniref:protein-associating with the carboxyl-terminal domain of ezrin-like n=1 Tax=Dysidea avara TaxID=196820 RepID=UPI003328F6D6
MGGAIDTLWPGSGEDTKKYVVKQSSDNLWSVANVVDPEIETADSTELVTEFSHHVSYDDLADFVDISIQRLRVLRHPNLLKFLSSYECWFDYAYDDAIYLLTELVSPLEVVIKSLSDEEMIKGLRDVARGLQFLHETALLAHNNLHMGNIFVREKPWCWKIGGFECALELKRVDDKFLEDIALIRKSPVIPPEDKVKGPTKSPPFTRDMWEFGQLVVAVVTTMESGSHDGLLDHSKTCLLSDNPEHRITAGQVLRKPWLQNELTDIVEFLEQLTVKKSDEKSEFFRSLPARLLSLLSQTLCRHIVPLLLTPLVMGEPAAQQYLWKHLFTPAVGDRRHHFHPDIVCPLILESDYRRHVFSHIISLLESREGHIRQVLLENLDGFSSICTGDDMETIVLPQVLIGLQETDDDLVAATLQGLSKMVPILGADVVMGTTRRSIFVNTRPKTPSNAVSSENKPKPESNRHTTP